MVDENESQAQTCNLRISCGLIDVFWPRFVLKVIRLLDLQALLLRPLNPKAAVLHHYSIQALVLQVP